ncbi:diacylglycerol kinase family protein [Acidovorax sp. Leaf78]|uniref:diacylglycerol/lipid kinase family protein n=1 Tax=unclassified Acidovorax TaxID=2684926 RepID=UPI0006FD344E|nr:diacylglycerol kinase family protein [Acidovorax sp. Leaf78]KQO27416.1 diacylglycerol kinase [Acidovorax sp. Leaf78]
MTPSDSSVPTTPRGPIHLVVPKRPGADFDLLRAKLEGVSALQSHDVVWHVPRERADIVQLAHDAAEAARQDGGLVVAAGGDGTINAVAAAALRAGVPMGVLPMGTFNYFAREHGLALDPEVAVQDLLKALDSGDMRPVQVGFVNQRLFLVNASVGLYPKLLAEREKASRRFGRSRMVAVASAVWSMFRPSAGRRWRVVMKTHQGAQSSQQEHLVTTLFVGNNPLQLDRMGLAEAKLVADGGMLGVVMLQPQGRWAVARTVWNAATGQLGKDSAVVSLACSELAVSPASWRPPQVKVAFDGEREWMVPPLQFSIGARPLWLVAPSPLVRDEPPLTAATAVASLAAVAAAIVPGLGDSDEAPAPASDPEGQGLLPA